MVPPWRISPACAVAKAALEVVKEEKLAERAYELGNSSGLNCAKSSIPC